MGRLVFLKGFKIGLLHILHPILPAAKDDPHPPEGHRADRGPVGFDLLTLGVVEGFGPRAVWQGTFGEFDKSLMKKGRSGPSLHYRVALSTAHNQRSHAREDLELLGRFPSLSIGSQSRHQSRRHDHSTS